MAGALLDEELAVAEVLGGLSSCLIRGGDGGDAVHDIVSEGDVDGAVAGVAAVESGV